MYLPMGWTVCLAMGWIVYLPMHALPIMCTRHVRLVDSNACSQRLFLLPPGMVVLSEFGAKRYTLQASWLPLSSCGTMVMMHVEWSRS